MRPGGECTRATGVDPSEDGTIEQFPVFLEKHGDRRRSAHAPPRRRELVAVRVSSEDQVQLLHAAAVQLVDDGGTRDTVDDEGFCEGATLEIERGR